MLPAIDRAVTTSTPTDSERTADVIQIWRLSDLRLLETMALPPVAGDSIHYYPFEIRAQPGGRTAMLNIVSRDLARVCSALQSVSPDKTANCQIVSTLGAIHPAARAGLIRFVPALTRQSNHWHDKCRRQMTLAFPSHSSNRLMPNLPRGPQPDPMAREVDRLLARLANGDRDQGAHPMTPAPHPATHAKSVVGVAAPKAPSRGELAALWVRVLLGVAFGGVMTQWPYPFTCGLPLIGYLGAVAMVMLTAAWIAFAAWRLRGGVAHILSLILFFWGIVLAAEQVLPRIGYAADSAAWRCPSPSPLRRRVMPPG